MAREHYWPTGSKTAQDQEKRALAVEHDRQVRHRSVANDCLLDLPVSISRQDGEEYPARPRLRSHDKRYEIQKPYIQGPPNKTVWDSIDCLERTVTQPSSSSSSSSRSGGNKSASKSSSSHWGLSWSRSNKSPPSQGRTSRGQSRQQKLTQDLWQSNPSTSVRNPPSSVCETARGKYGGGSGGGEGLLDGPLLSSFIPSSSSSSPSASSLGTIPHSSPLGFHGAATSLVAGDTVHSAFANHNHHHHSPNPSASHQHHHPTPTTTSKPPQQESLVFSGVESGAGVDVPSGGNRFSSEKVQQQHGTARTSPNNNSSTSTPSPSTSVLQRLIDPEMKLFSRNSSPSTCSKESRRSNNNANANNSNHGKNGKSHRTDQSLSAASSSSAMATDKINPSCSGRRGSGRTAITCGGPSSSSSSTTPGVERMMTTEDAYCYGADTDATDDDGAILFSRCSSSDMKDGDAEGCLTVDGQGVMGRDTNTTLKLSPQQPPFMLSSPSALSFNNSQHVRMSSSVPSASPMFNCNNFNSEAAAGAGAAAVAPDSSSCLVSERKRNLHEHFTSSGYRTDPNYSTFVSNKMMIGSSCRNNNSPQTPPPSCSGNSASCSDCSSSSAGRSVQSQYGLVVVGTAAPETNKECLSTMDTGDSANNKATVGKETAHHCELSETFIASNKNDNCTDPDQYCTAAELTISSSSPLQTRNNNEERGTPTSSSESSPFSQSSSSSSALSLGQPDNRHSSPASP